MVPYFVQDVVGHISGMPGLFISSVFSASLSTISANLNSFSGIIYNDYIRPFNLFKHTDAAANLSMKVTIVIIGIFCILSGFVVEQFAYISQVTNTIIGMTCGAVFGVFCLGMLYPRANNKAALWSTIVSMLVLCWIITGTQVLISKKQLIYEPMDSRIDGCESRNITVTPKNQSYLLEFQKENSTSHAIVGHDHDEFDFFYRISFQWYPFLGAIIVWIIGIPLSHILGTDEDLDKLNINLIAPQAKFLIPQRLLHIELALKRVITDNEYKNGNTKDDKESKLLNEQNGGMWSPTGQNSEKE